MIMIGKPGIALLAAILLGSASPATASSLPSIDVQRTCRASVDVSFADKADSVDICVRAEWEARERLVEAWASFSASEKARCILRAEYLPGYVEWLTCVELERHLRGQRDRADR